MRRILSVEDNVVVQTLISIAMNGYLVDHASTLKAARELIRRRSYDLVLLDLKLPDGDGTVFYAELQVDPNLREIPVIVLSAHCDVQQKVSAFALGVDDFMEKPAAIAELRARVEMRLKKAERFRRSFDELKLEDLRLSRSQQTVWLCQDGGQTPIDLTSHEFRILMLLIKESHRTLSRESILQEVWGARTHVTLRTVDTHVSHLRKKLDASRVRIDTAVGQGYRLTTEAVRPVLGGAKRRIVDRNAAIL